jgi:transposase-like protein
MGLTMSDLTRWLRTYWSDNYDGPPIASDELGRKAADEIERLCNIVTTQEDALKEFHAEIERLQKVLEHAKHLLAGGDEEAVYHLNKAIAAAEEQDNE